MSRQVLRTLLGFLILTSTAFALRAADPVASEKGKLSDDKSTRWFDLRVLKVEGQAWTETKAPFDRFPAKAEKTVRAGCGD